jgi:hypothetical protein
MNTMKINSWKSALALGGICAFTLLAKGAPLQRAEVAANPAWIVHLDCDALRPTTLGKYVLSEMDKPEAKAKLAAFQALVEVDLRTQLHGATLYGLGPGPEQALLMIYADFDTAHLVTLAKAAKDSQVNPHGNVDIYNWLDENRKATNGLPPRIYAAIQGNRVLFGQREDCVSRGLDVLAGTAPNLTSGAWFPELGQRGGAHFFEAAARKLALPAADPSAAILKLAQSVQLMLGETQQQFTAAVTLVADNAEVSGHVLAIAQGLLALGKLQTDKPETLKIANAINLTQTGDQVLGILHLPATDLVEVIKADAARKAAQAAKETKN